MTSFVELLMYVFMYVVILILTSNIYVMLRKTERKFDLKNGSLILAPLTTVKAPSGPTSVPPSVAPVPATVAPPSVAPVPATVAPPADGAAHNQCPCKFGSKCKTFVKSGKYCNFGEREKQPKEHNKKDYGELRRRCAEKEIKILQQKLKESK
jgi:hypothetical protein